MKRKNIIKHLEDRKSKTISPLIKSELEYLIEFFKYKPKPVEDSRRSFGISSGVGKTSLLDEILSYSWSKDNNYKRVLPAYNISQLGNRERLAKIMDMCANYAKTEECSHINVQILPPTPFGDGSLVCVQCNTKLAILKNG